MKVGSPYKSFEKEKYTAVIAYADMKYLEKRQ